MMVTMNAVPIRETEDRSSVAENTVAGDGHRQPVAATTLTTTR